MARLALGLVVMGHKYELAVTTFFDPKIGLASWIMTAETISLFELLGIDWVETKIAGHKVERTLAMNAFPRNSFVSPLGRIAFWLVAIVTDHVAAIEPTFASTDRPHPILSVAQYC